jgi:hypothetical protein
MTGGGGDLKFELKFPIRWRAREGCNKKRTDDGFPIFLDFERTFAISDQEREVKEVLDGLRKIVRVDDESKKIHGAILFHEQVSNLNARTHAHKD